MCGKLSLKGDDISGLTIYRGWMMKPIMYRNFYSKLRQKEITLINTSEEYEKYHLFPNWYEDFKDETIESIWINSFDIKIITEITKNLKGSYIVKDFVKSRKHEWNDACFIKDICPMER